MAYEQAPMIKVNGDKMRKTKIGGFCQRGQDLEIAIMNGLGPKDMAMLKIMLFLTGNSEGFRVAEKTIMERCNISESGYKTARKKLVDMGWISHTPGVAIEVNINNILNSGMGSSENTSSSETEKIEGYSEKSSLGISENTSLGYSQNTHNNITNNINKQDKTNEFVF